MSYLSIALRRIAEKNEIPQRKIAKAAGKTCAHISRLFSGIQKTITDPDLLAVLQTITKDPVERAEIIAARCVDVCVGTEADLVEIKIRKLKGQKQKTRREEQPFPYPDLKLSRSTERAFAWLRSQCPLNPELERVIVGYARLTGMEE